MTELMNSSGKCVHRSGLRGVFPQTSTALEVCFATTAVAP